MYSFTFKDAPISANDHFKNKLSGREEALGERRERKQQEEEKEEVGKGGGDGGRGGSLLWGLTPAVLWPLPPVFLGNHCSPLHVQPRCPHWPLPPILSWGLPPSAPAHDRFPWWKSFGTTLLSPLETPASCLPPSQVVSQCHTSRGSPDSLPHNSSSHQLLSRGPLKCLEACWLSDALTLPQSLFWGDPSVSSHVSPTFHVSSLLFFSDPPPPFSVRQDPHGGLLVPHPLSPFNPCSAPRASPSTSLRVTD